MGKKKGKKTGHDPGEASSSNSATQGAPVSQPAPAWQNAPQRAPVSQPAPAWQNAPQRAPVSQPAPAWQNAPQRAPVSQTPLQVGPPPVRGTGPVRGPTPQGPAHQRGPAPQSGPPPQRGPAPQKSGPSSSQQKGTTQQAAPPSNTQACLSAGVSSLSLSETKEVGGGAKKKTDKPPQQKPADKKEAGGDAKKGTDKPPQQKTVEKKEAGGGAKKGPDKPPQQKNVSKGSFTIPARKNLLSGGTLGRRTVVEVNQFALNLSNLVEEIIHYDVAFEPDRPKRLLRPALQQFAAKHFPNARPAFDGMKNLYAPKMLPFGAHIEDTVTVINNERQANNELEFKIHVRFAAKILTEDLTKFMRGDPMDIPQTAIQAVDIVMRSAPLQGQIVPVGRSFFHFPDNVNQIINLGGGLELWHGFYQSAILGWKPFLNVDVAHKGFPKPINLIDLLVDVCSGRDQINPDRPLDPQSYKKFKGFITTLKVDYGIPGVDTSRRTHRVNNLGPPAGTLKFQTDDNAAEITVAQYFQTVKKYKLRFPNLPTVQVDPPGRNIFLPMELCKLKEGQALNRKLDEEQTAVMVKAAARPPSERKQRILESVRKANYNRNDVVNAFGIKVSDEMTKVNARVLDAPNIEYAGRRITPPPGAWRAGRFLFSKPLSKWFMLVVDDRTRIEKCYEFSRMLMNKGRELGMNISECTNVKSVNIRSRTLKADIINNFDQFKRDQAEIVFVVIPNAGEVYSMVKQVAELQVGLLTQCIKSKTMFKMNPSTCENILQKVNSKTNGVNHSLGNDYRPAVLQTPVMFVGIDVTHPSPDQTTIPSVAAVSASHDARALFQYNMIWSLQPPRVEIVQDLKNIMVSQLRTFRAKTGQQPTKIIVYRDGVSEGQFQQVLSAELIAIREACTSLSAAYKPGITFIVVQKRHHIRFFPTKREDEDGKNRNVKPGTIVDTTITHPRELDFYLVSHSSLQGTSRPTKYHRLWDDNNISEDEMEEMTYYLCYLFSRCTRSVSYPAPTYYAHLAAFRARAYLENNPAPLNNLRGFSERNKIEPNFMVNSPMFFV